MKAWRGLLEAAMLAIGVVAACAQSAPVLGNIEAPYPALQSSVTLASIQWGPGAVAYGPVGTPLVLTGHDLGFSGTVQFIAYKNGAVDLNVNPVAATVTLWTSNMLIVTVPSGAMSGLVKVTTESLTSNGLPFMVTPGTYAGTCPAGPATTQLQITTASLHDGNAGEAYSATLGATGGTTAYTWSSGTLPAGLTLNASTGVISGTPTAASGPVDITFQVTDSSSPNQHDQAVLSLSILSPSIPASTSATVYNFNVSSYDGVGNLLGYSDTVYDGTTVVNSVMGTWSFTYDSLNRLISGTPSAGTFTGKNYCLAYDPFGNRTVQSIQTAACPTLPAVPAGAITFTSNNQVPNTVTGAGAVSYDTAGNALSAVTSVGQTYYVYDGEGRVCAEQSTPMPGITSMTGYLYDADGTRVAKGTITSMSCDPTTNGFQFTENYVLGPGGEELSMFGVAAGGSPGATTAWQRTNVYAAGKVLATYDLISNPAYVDGGSQPRQIAGLHFHIEDPLGTRRMQLSGEIATLGCPETDIQSLPFGDGLSTFPDQYNCGEADDSTPLHFTGKERDAESGNDYFGARYYASSMGRWLSPDWSAKEEPVPYAKLDDPQSLNLYAYVQNNPTRGVDSDGHAMSLEQYHESLWSTGHPDQLGEDDAIAGRDSDAYMGQAQQQATTGTPRAEDGQQAQQQVGNTTESSLAKVLTNEDGSLSTPKKGDPQELVDGKTALANAIYNNANLPRPEKVAPDTGTASAQDSQIMQGVVNSRTSGGADPVQGRHYYGTSHNPNLKSRPSGNGRKGAAGREKVFARFGPFHDSISPKRQTYIYIYNAPGQQ